MNDPGLEQRRKAGRRVLLGFGCLVPFAFVLFLAVWQFLSPGEHDAATPRRAASAVAPSPSP